MENKICDNCGKEFLYRGRHGTRNKHFFCCYDCYIRFKIKKVEVPCDLCNKTFLKKLSDIKRSKYNFCCEECYRSFISLNRHGKGGPKYKGKPVYRLMIEHELGRELSSEEHVHHIDGNHKNNALSNMVVVSRSEHQKIHAASRQRNEKGQFVRRGVMPHEVHST